MALHAELIGFAALSDAVARDGDGAVGAEELGAAVNRCLEPLRTLPIVQYFTVWISDISRVLDQTTMVCVQAVASCLDLIERYSVCSFYAHTAFRTSCNTFTKLCHRTAVDIVYAAGGDVFKMSPDALTVVWQPQQPPQPHPSASANEAVSLMVQSAGQVNSESQIAYHRNHFVSECVLIKFILPTLAPPLVSLYLSINLSLSLILSALFSLCSLLSLI